MTGPMGKMMVMSCKEMGKMPRRYIRFTRAERISIEYAFDRGQDCREIARSLPTLGIGDEVGCTRPNDCQTR